MKIFDLEKFKKARVWLDELPQCEYVSSQVLTHTVPASTVGRTTIRRAAIELLVPLGPRSMYALIGGEYSPANSSTLEVELAVSDDGLVFPESLASPNDVVKIGLPSEYAHGVINGIDLGCAELSDVAPGKIRIACAAHGLMWSSEAIYSKAASVLIKLINLGQANMTDKAIVALLLDQQPKWNGGKKTSYICVKWIHSTPTEPTMIYSELDVDRWELRKVELYLDGHVGFASSSVRTDGTVLSKEPIPLLSEIASDPQFEPQEIAKDEFEQVWSKAFAQAQPQEYL
jgi:hypothetical protein